MLCRTIGDLLGEAKASGNLGNTLKVLGRFDEAVVCCQRHLDIARDISDKVRLWDTLWYSWSLFTLKHPVVCGGIQNTSTALTCSSCTRVRWVRRELCITSGMCTMPKAKVSAGVELSPEISQRRWWWLWGRQPSTMSEWLHSTVLVNVYVSVAYQWHSDCYFRANLAIVKELGDRAAQGRTYGNLGNTHYLLGNFRRAVASHEQVWCNPQSTLFYQNIFA